jgi:hypothetical protein
MEKSSWRKFLRGASLQKDIEDIKDLAVRYIKEETVKPVKELGRYMFFGAIGSLFVGIGASLLLFGLLRFLQRQFPVLNGTLSWIPYLIVAFVSGCVLALTAWRITSGVAKRRLKD